VAAVGLEPDLQPEQQRNEDDEGDKNDANNNIDNEQPPTALAAEPEGGQDQQYRYDNNHDPAGAAVDQHPNDPNIGHVPPLVAAAASAATAPVALSLPARLRQVEREALEDPNHNFTMPERFHAIGAMYGIVLRRSTTRGCIL